MKPSTLIPAFQLLLSGIFCDGFVVPKPARISAFERAVSESRNYPVYSGGLNYDDLDNDFKLFFPDSQHSEPSFAASGLSRSRVSGKIGSQFGGLYQGPPIEGKRYDDDAEIFGPGFDPCYDGEVLNIDGACERPLVSRNFFIYAAPQRSYELPSPPPIPKPKVNYNVVFIRNPDQPEDLDPIVVPPPQQKTLVYVLNKAKDIDQDIIEVPPGPVQRPEVFYVNYDEGENPQLPFGLDLQTALANIDPGTYGENPGFNLYSNADSLAAKLNAEAKINAAAQLKAAAGALRNDAATSLNYGVGDSLSLSPTTTKIYGPSKP